MKICPECLERVDEQHNHCPDDGTELRVIHARDEDPMEGRILEEKWVLESRIGGGGMGTVYRAHQLSVDRTVAVKVLRSALCDDDEHVERFFREANVASNIHDPRCVTIYDFGQTADDHVLYLAMEHLEGVSLQQQVRERMLTFEETLEVGIQVCEALSVLHENGVVHRDLKPENVFLVDDIGNEVFLKLLDFGLAKVTQSDETPVTATGKIFGTPAFMSPEQCMGSDVHSTSDLYALGCMLFQLVTGHTPFEGSSSVETLLGHVNRRPPELSGRVAVPAGFEDLIDELLSKAPGDRPPSADGVRERLGAILDEVNARTAAQSPLPPEERESRLEAVAETLPGDSDAAGPGPDQRAEDGGYKQTKGGAGPVRKRDDETSEGDEEDSQEIEAEPSGATPESADNVGIRFAVAACVFIVGLAAMWMFMEPIGPSLEGNPEGPRASAARMVGGTPYQEARRLVHRGAGGTAYAFSTFPGTTAFGIAGAATLMTSAPGEQSSETSSTPASSRASTRDAETEERKESEGDDAMLPVLTQTAATQVFRSKSGEIKTCFEKAAGEPDFDGGTVKLRLVVEASGMVEDVSITSTSIEHVEVENCVRDRAETWEFPPTPNDGTAVLRHEYAFEWKKLQ